MNLMESTVIKQPLRPSATPGALGNASATARMLCCTLTGADDSVAVDELWALGTQFPEVEWGVLYSESQQGVGRYPSFEWIEALAARLGTDGAPRFALHVCGRAVGQLLAGRGHVCEIANVFPRIQINFNALQYPLAVIRNIFEQRPLQTLITQANLNNEGLWRYLTDMPNHCVLFDQSGGRGLSPAGWPSPLGASAPAARLGPLCGYAGGLGPDNLASELPKIIFAAAGRPFWLDMEGKLRNERDRFDVMRAWQCLTTVRSTLAGGAE